MPALMKWLLVCALLVLAGCSGSSDSATSGGLQAASSSDASAQGGYDYALFLGLTGTEGDLNWTAYEDALRDGTDPGATIAEMFDQDVDNGELGDGLLGSWLTTHFIFDEEQQLLGGLYTQYRPDGESLSAFAPFRGPYAGTPELPHQTTQGTPHQPAPGTPHPADPTGTRTAWGMLQEMEQEQVLCGLLSSMDDMEVDSHEAARIAAERPIFQEHVADNPDGEYTYYYFPQLGVEEGCAAELTTQSNYWVVSHTDLDAFLTGESASVVEVRVDAATGEVLDETVRPLFERPPLRFEHVLTVEDPMVPQTRSHVHNITVLVTERVERLRIDVLQTERPEGVIDPSTRLRDPAGRILETRSLADPSHTYTVRDAMPGTWKVEYVYQSLKPEGGHTIEATSILSFS